MQQVENHLYVSVAVRSFTKIFVEESESATITNR